MYIVESNQKYQSVYTILEGKHRCLYSTTFHTLFKTRDIPFVERAYAKYKRIPIELVEGFE